MDDQKENSTSKKVAGEDNDAIVVGGNVNNSVVEIHRHYHSKPVAESVEQPNGITIHHHYYTPVEKPGDIFISYARTDAEIVQAIYKSLVSKKHHPWMDIFSIKGGENWLRAITRAIDECEIFLAILSNNSVSRRGVIQKELKKALDKWDGMLPDDIYIIPIRIDDCPIPDLLRHIQVLDWDGGKGRNKLLEAIRVGLARRKTDG